MRCRDLLATAACGLLSVAGCSNQMTGGASAAPASIAQPTPGSRVTAVGSGTIEATARDAGYPMTPSTHVTVTLRRLFEGGSVVSFGVPVPRGALASAGSVRATAGKVGLNAAVRPLLFHYNRQGEPIGIASLLVQFPASALTGQATDVTIAWTGGSSPPLASTPYAQLSTASPESATVVDRTVAHAGGQYRWVESNRRVQTIFTAREPYWLASFPPGYLAGAGVLNQFLRARQDVPRNLKGLRFLSDYVRLFGESATFELPYALHPKAVTDLAKEYEAWLYDRCATLLVFYAHTGDQRMLRHGYRACAYYADHIQTDGPNRGISSIKPDPDSKYSHLRGLYAYYALTGDEVARAAGVAIADMWYEDRAFVQPYANGHMRSPEALWTERLLGTSLEGLYYGYLLTGDLKYLRRFEQLLDTAYRHITTHDQNELNAITQLGKPTYPGFPPQNCFVHSAQQHAEGDAGDPWCSGWMSELLVDPLLRYQEQTGDRRADEILVRLARFLRDTGTSYFSRDPRPDSFLKPSMCYDRTDTENPRILVPLYGSGVATGGHIKRSGEWPDFEHCPDSLALTAAALRALRRLGGGTGGPIGPFANERLSLEAMHREFGFCAAYAFRNATRRNRDPRSWTSAQLAEGYQGGDVAAQQRWIEKNLIGFPIHPTSPQRKLSWWFNSSLLQYGLLADADVSIETVGGGAVQPAGCH